MSADEFSHILRALKGVTEYVYYHLMGEPLTHPELPKFLEMAKESGFKSMLVTNGTLLKKRGDEILASGVHRVSISLHSFEEGSEVSYDRYMSEVCDFADKASNMGVIVVLRLWNKGFDGGRNDLAYEFLRSRFPDGVWKENSRGVRIKDKLHLELGDRFIWPDREAPFQSDSAFCYGLKDHFGILCDGSVVPCCLDSDGAITLGNIFKEDIGDILSSDRARAIDEGFGRRAAVEELCKRCSYAQRF